MNMEFRNTWVLPVGLISIAVFAVILYRIKRRRSSYQGGVRTANTWIVSRLPSFRKAYRARMALNIGAVICLFAAIISSVILAARPARSDTVTAGQRRRDIYLCMDSCFSDDNWNEVMLDAMIDLVGQMDGDRFGICLFNYTSIVYVPMTDDYDYIILKLQELKDYFRLGVELDQEMSENDLYSYDFFYDNSQIPEELMNKFTRFQKISATIDGTYADRSRGAVRAGDGLASTLYSFPDLDSSDRTRVIIISTENVVEVGSTPIVTTPQAGQLCQGKHVTVFGLYRGDQTYGDETVAQDRLLTQIEPANTPEEARADLLTCVSYTGGKLYDYNGNMTASEIVADICRQKAMQVDDITVTRETDLPQVPVYILLAAVTGLMVIGIRLRMNGIVSVQSEAGAAVAARERTARFEANSREKKKRLQERTRRKAKSKAQREKKGADTGNPGGGQNV